MGPQIILDKSTLQSLSRVEAMRLNTHYYVVYTPILFAEILGDLKKEKPSQDKARRQVAGLAQKISGMDGCFTADYRILLFNELMGIPVKMGHRPIRPGGREVVTKNGQKGLVFDEGPEYKALRRWLGGQFSQAEELLSDSWRKSTRSFDLESWLKVLHQRKATPKFENMGEVVSMSHVLETDKSLQWEQLHLLLLETGFRQEDRDSVFNRWLKIGMPPLISFAPYAVYCLRVFRAFYLGIAARLIGTKSTNRIDLEYLLYLPFCKVFSSTDMFLRKMVPHFLDGNQDFVWGSELKDDLHKISKDWESLTDSEKSEFHRKYDCCPPKDDNSVTYKLWTKHCGSPQERMSLTPEREKEIMKEISPFLDAIKEIEND